MKNTSLYAVILIVAFAVVSSFAQTNVLINQPGVEPIKADLSAAEKNLMDRNVLPKVRKKLANDSCTEDINVAGIAQGAFTKPGSNQTLVFYQFCQTGNGFGSTGIFVIEGDKLAANYIEAESGWTVDAKVLPDINKNGLNEVALYYSGGMHQGQGGTGVDIMEVSNGALKGIGWFQADGFDENSEWAFRVTVKPGATPAFFHEKWVGTNTPGKYRKAGRPLPLKLKPVFGKFEAVR